MIELRDANWVDEATLLRTEIRNRRPGEIAICMPDGRVMFRLEAGRTAFVDSWTNESWLAPYEEVTYERNGTISLKARRGFIDPLKDAPWVLTLENRGKNASESILVATEGRYVPVPRHIPVRVAVDIHDPLVIYERVLWEIVRKKLPHPQSPDYLVEHVVNEERRIPRREKELKKIRQLRVAIEEETQRKSIKDRVEREFYRTD